MQIEESDNSKELKDAHIIESNCEYLTLIRNLATPRANSQKNTLKTLEKYMEQLTEDIKLRLNYETLLQLFIELGYFLYACRNFGKSPLIEMDSIRVEETFVKVGEKKFTIVIFYRIQDKTMQDMEGTNFFNGIYEHIDTALATYLEKNSKNQEPPSAETQFQLAFKAFEKQYKIITTCSFFESKQQAFFRALEQTNLFYEYSMLFRINSSSMLEFLRQNPEKIKEFKEARQKDETLLSEYRQEKKKSKGEPEALRAKERQIDANLSDFFRKINPNFFIVSPPSKSDKDQASRVKFHFLLKSKSKPCFQEFLAQLQGQESEMSIEKKGNEGSELRHLLSDSEFYIEYSSERNSICVRLFVPTIQVNVDTSDLLMFHSNVLTFEAVNVSIELSEPKISPELKAEMKPENKAAVKIVAFKSTSSFNVKEPFLTKILLLMDITMIACRIYQPELSSQRYGQPGGKDIYHKLATISKKVNHYTKLYMKCAKKIYGQ